MRFGPLVTADWLREHLRDPDIRMIDFRWYLLDRKGRDEYVSGHIPGAVFVDLEAVTGKQDANARGRHPLPSATQFESEMRKAGIDEKTKVVVYDDAGGSIAARLWFLLGWFGHGAQAVLDGGMQAWGKPLETSITFPAAGSFQATEPDRSRILDFDEVCRRARAGRPQGGPHPWSAQRAVDGQPRPGRALQVAGGAARALCGSGR